MIQREQRENELVVLYIKDDIDNVGPAPNELQLRNSCSTVPLSSFLALASQDHALRALFGV